MNRDDQVDSPPAADELAAAHVYLSAVCERPTAAMWDLVDELGAVEAAERIRSREVSGAVAAQTTARADDVRVDELLEAGAAVGARFLYPGHPDWPTLALEPLDLPRRRMRAGARGEASLALRPLGLWWRGPADPGAVVRRSAAIVGTRAPSPYGRMVTGDLAAACVAAGMPVVSGGAFGVDATAHRAVTGSAGVTVAVLAGGVDSLYPRANADLLAEVSATGALVAEHPPGEWVTRFRFLDRNRLIAALSGATVVVEAALRSGALSTAAWARGLGRPVGAVPGPVTAVTSLGCHELIRENRAVLVGDGAHVVELAGAMGEMAEPRRAPSTVFDGLDDVERRVWEAVPPTGGAGTERIAAASGVSAGRVRVVLGGLRSRGLVSPGEQGWVRDTARGLQLRLGDEGARPAR